jgi:transcriptional regulator with XRE-family HTH domain
MIISERLKALRIHRDMSQGDIESRTGLKRCYVSRVENGHTVPSIETLEKFARALEVPMYAIFYEGDQPAQPPNFPGASNGKMNAWGSAGKDARMLYQFQRAFETISHDERQLLLQMAAKMSKKSGKAK